MEPNIIRDFAEWLAKPEAERRNDIFGYFRAFEYMVDTEKGNAADGDRFRVPADYGAGAETCPECEGRGYWVAARYFIPEESPERDDGIRLLGRENIECETCHGLGVVVGGGFCHKGQEHIFNEVKP